MKLNQRQVQHLYWRAGLFAPYPVIKAGINKTPERLYDSLLRKSKPCETLLAIDEAIVKKYDTIDFNVMKGKTASEKKALNKASKDAIKNLNIKWINFMSNTEGVLRERMSLFWHDHFACRSKNAAFVQGYLDIIRKNSLGSFKTMLFEVSKAPAMLQYLNNQQNKKGSPNENFAREVMELFTLGRGNYSEEDIKNAARAFTGWRFNRRGEFVLSKKHHDFGLKTLFGKTDPFEGEDVLNLLLENRETARHICTKLYRYLVNEEIDEARVAQLASIFYDGDYQIAPVLRAIFTSEWFYEDKNIGAKIKSPMDLIIGLRRSLYASFNDPNGQIFLQTQLGQILLSPPNVSGWPGGQFWVDSSTLLLRARLTEILLRNSQLEMIAKKSGDDFDQFKINKKLKKLGGTIDKTQLSEDFKGIKDLSRQVALYFLQLPMDESIDFSSSDDSLIESIITTSKTPEFQLC